MLKFIYVLQRKNALGKADIYEMTALLHNYLKCLERKAHCTYGQCGREYTIIVGEIISW